MSATPRLAQQKPALDPARADAAIKSAFPTAPADWQSRLVPDETMRQCSAHRNTPPKAVAEAIQQREKATIVYPPDGKFVGDWKKGEAIAQSGYGLRFTDYPPRSANGGNCYACHQMTKQEVSYGTLGPSLLALRQDCAISARPTPRRPTRRSTIRRRRFRARNMPRFGTNKVLTIEQIKDAGGAADEPGQPGQQVTRWAPAPYDRRRNRPATREDAHAEEQTRDHRRARGVRRRAGVGDRRARQPGADSTSPQIKKDTDVACLYHCDFGDPQRFSQMLQNMLNHYSAYEFDTFKLKLVVVAHGAGHQVLPRGSHRQRRGKRRRSIREIYQRFVGLTKYGVEAYLCQITYKRLKIDPAKTRKDAFLKFVPSGVATVAELQAKGFAYLKVG